MLQATDALAAAHDVGVVHRDLKPSNLLLTHDDRIKVVDFGVAKRRLDAPGSTEILTSQGEVLGTPAYLSPEQLEHGLADERSDVWGLGCVLFELCMGSPPFGRSSSAATTAAILRDEPAFPSSLSPAVVDVIQACLRKSSFARVASMRELGVLFKDALDQTQGAPTASARPSERQSVAERASRAASTRPSTRPPPVAPSTQSPSSSPPPPRLSEAPPHPPSVHPPTQRPSTSARPLRTSAPPTTHTSSSIRVARGRMKGTAIRTGMLWFQQRYGAAALEQSWASSSPELKALVRLDDPSFGFVASGWYDTRLVGELLTSLEQVVGPDDPDTWASALAEAIAKDNVNGVYRSLFRLITTPAMLEANAQRVWRTYCDEGTLVVDAPRAGELHLEIRQWTHHDEHACRVVGFAIQHVLRAIGYQALVIERTLCVSLGDPACTFEGMYLPK
jgi:serine/threonine protein kinase